MTSYKQKKCKICQRERLCRAYLLEIKRKREREGKGGLYLARARERGERGDWLETLELFLGGREMNLTLEKRMVKLFGVMLISTVGCGLGGWFPFYL